jgi:cleavage stimulation factor subunit 3
MDPNLASAQQPHQLPANVPAITHDPATSAPAQRVPDHSAAVQLEEPSPKPELSSSEVVQTTADILQVLQKLQAQQSVTPPTPQTTSFTPKPELQPQPVSVAPKEEPQPTTPTTTITTTTIQEEPVSEWDALRASLRENPHDTEGWNKLVRMAEDSGDLEKIKDAYESLLKMYPNTVRNLQSVVNYVLLT